MSKLAGKVAVVTGASKGIGAGIAKALAQDGAAVVVNYASSKSGADAVVAAITSAGGRAIAVQGDVSRASEAQGVIEAAVREFGRLDVLVNNSGIYEFAAIEEVTEEHYRRQFDVNVLGVLNTVHVALDRLRSTVPDDPADVIVISSMSGRRRSSVELGFYSASKFAVHVLSDSLREELGPEGVRVTVISPGFVDTPIFDGVTDDVTRERYRDAVATQGLDPGVVAAQVVHALAQPPGVDLVEIAMLSTDQH